MTRTQIGTATVSNGVAETTYTVPADTTPGSHTLYAVYQQNDDYMTAEGYNSAQIRIPTEITVSDVLASIGETATFTAYVKHHTNQNVDAGTVQFQLGGSNIGTPVTVTNGVATLQYEIPSNTSDGTAITATFIQTNTYGSSTTSSSGTLSIRGSTNVTVTNVSANRSSTATINATVTDSEGDPITSGQAQLYIDNTISGEPQTVSDGQVSFSYSVANNAVVGSHTIKVTYIQNNSYDSADGTGTLIVRTPTVLTAVDVSANKGTTASLTILVKDENGTAIPNGTVNITVGNDSPVSATVNASGEATISYSVPNNASGTISFTATYVENTNYQAGSTSTAGVITIRKGVTVVVDSVQGELGESITLSASITDEDSQSVNEGTVNYELD